MRLLLVILFVLPLMVSAQKEITLKKKYLGSYTGVVPAYQMDSEVGVIDVAETPIKVTIAKESINLTIGNREMKGTYAVMFEADEYFLVDAKIEGQMANEHIMVYKKDKKISRTGMFPQPVAELMKNR